MDANYDARRRSALRALTGASLLIATGALPALAQGVAQNERQQAAARKTLSDGLVPVTEVMMRGNALVDRVLLIYEAGIRRVGGGEDIELVVFKQTAEVMRDFVHDIHEKAEEELVFPHFKKAGRMVPLVDALVAQHAKGHQLTTTILQNAATANTTEKKAALLEAMKATLVLYRAHTSREDTDLFPTLRSLVTPVQFEEISETMDKKLRDAFGPDGLDKVAKRIEALEKKIGVHELGTEAKPKE